MKRNFNFSVSVIGCNADTFHNNYNKYIKSFRDGFYDNKIFFLYATKRIYDEIAGLVEEGIDIIGYDKN